MSNQLTPHSSATEFGSRLDKTKTVGMIPATTIQPSVEMRSGRGNFTSRPSPKREMLESNGVADWYAIISQITIHLRQNGGTK